MTSPLLQSFLAALSRRPDWAVDDNRDAELLFYALATAAGGDMARYEDETVAALYDLRAGFGCWLNDVAAAIAAMDMHSVENPEQYRAGLQAALQMARVFLYEINIDATRRRPEVNERGYFTGWAVPDEEEDKR